MHERRVPILPRQTNIVIIPDVELSNDQNKQTINKCRDVIANIIPSSIKTSKFMPLFVVPNGLYNYK